MEGERWKVESLGANVLCTFDSVRPLAAITIVFAKAKTFNNLPPSTFNLQPVTHIGYLTSVSPL